VKGSIGTGIGTTAATITGNRNNTSIVDSKVKPASRQQSPYVRTNSKKKTEVVNNDKQAMIKSQLIHSLKVSRQNSPKAVKSGVEVMKTDIFKQIGNKGSLNNVFNKKANTSIVDTSKCGKETPTGNTTSGRKEDPVLKVQHNINHNINHSIHININHNDNIRSTNISPFESTLSKYSNESSKRSEFRPNKLLSGIKNKNTNLSISKITELQNQSKLMEKIKVFNEEKMKKVGSIRLNRQPVSIDEIDIDRFGGGKDEVSAVASKESIRLTLKPRLDNSISETMFGKVTTKELLNNSVHGTSSKKQSDSIGSLISEESIFSKKCKG
jgi:hypothetical protein